MRRAGHREHQVFPEAALIALELLQRRGEPARIAGELRALEVGVVLARAREAELQQAADGGREVEQQERGEGDVGIAQQPRRQVEDRQEQREIGQRLREAGHDVGQAHDGEVVVADVADLVRQHAGELVQRQAAQQALGDADHGLVGRAGGEGVERHAGDDVDARRGRQLGAPAQLVDDVEDLPAVARVERPRAIHAHDHLGRQARGEGVERADRHQRDQHARPGPEQPRREGRDAGRARPPAGPNAAGCAPCARGGGCRRETASSARSGCARRFPRPRRKGRVWLGNIGPLA